MERTPQERPRHPMGVVADRTGLTPHVLRAWERRYGAVEPERTEGGQRLYSDTEVEKLRLLRRVTQAGRAIGVIGMLRFLALASSWGSCSAFQKASRNAAIRSVVPHESGNLLVSWVEHRGTKPLVLRIETCADQFANRATVALSEESVRSLIAEVA